MDEDEKKEKKSKAEEKEKEKKGKEGFGKKVLIFQVRIFGALFQKPGCVINLPSYMTRI
jgi:hypothetical protein